MSMGAFEGLADAIMQFEGWKLASRSWRNRNPGNLRRASDTLVGQPVDKDGYRIFETLDQGWLALKKDIEAKIYYAIHSKNPYVNHGLIETSTLLDFLNVYAPAGDNNNPTQYTKFVCSWMSAILTPIVVTPQTSLKDIANM